MPLVKQPQSFSRKAALLTPVYQQMFEFLAHFSWSLEMRDAGTPNATISRTDLQHRAARIEACFNLLATERRLSNA